MTKTFYSLIVLLLLAMAGQAQLVSQFTWDTNPVTKAAYGPDATASGGMTATSTSGGAAGTNGLNPNSHDVGMTMAGSTFTSMQGIDISVDFMRKENGASFFSLGGFDFGIATGSIYIKYVLKVGGSDVTRTQNAQYGPPTDNAFHTFRFVFNNNTGVATLSVDGVTVKTYATEAAGTVLSWTGAGTATIAGGLDGSGSNIAVLDNLIIQYPPTLLPLNLLSFDAAAAGGAGNKLGWTTASESGVKEFVVERSADGVTYFPIGVVAAGGGVYSFVDGAPGPVNFYRLKMVDIDGAFSYSPVKKVGGAAGVSLSCYPNPVVDYVNVKVGGSGAAKYMISSLDGKILQSGIIHGGQASLNVAGAPKGMMIVRVENEVFKVFKQ
ncbi:MAG: T9SS type A sorting domain-containing protein [Bacteroidetes bacterium]|nr:T9SS type A sorting domain-containing protein [Bacteroidota bacterium]